MQSHPAGERLQRGRFGARRAEERVGRRCAADKSNHLRRPTLVTPGEAGRASAPGTRDLAADIVPQPVQHAVNTVGRTRLASSMMGAFGHWSTAFTVPRHTRRLTDRQANLSRNRAARFDADAERPKIVAAVCRTNGARTSAKLCGRGPAGRSRIGRPAVPGMVVRSGRVDQTGNAHGRDVGPETRSVGIRSSAENLQMFNPVGKLFAVEQMSQREKPTGANTDARETISVRLFRINDPRCLMLMSFPRKTGLRAEGVQPHLGPGQTPNPDAHAKRGPIMNSFLGNRNCYRSCIATSDNE